MSSKVAKTLTAIIDEAKSRRNTCIFMLGNLSGKHDVSCQKKLRGIVKITISEVFPSMKPIGNVIFFRFPILQE